MKDGSVPATLVMGPWSHGSWARGDGDTLGNLKFTEKTGPFYREQIEFPFFLPASQRQGQRRKYRKPQGTTPKAWVFATGSDQWHRVRHLAAHHALRRSLYLGRAENSPSPRRRHGGQFDEYLSDPARPVPVASEISVNLGVDYMTHDQRFASRRPDVLTYETEPLEQALTIAGPVTPVCASPPPAPIRISW